LARYRFNLTAIDIGPSMIAAAQHRLDASATSFQIASFEDFAAAEASFDLVVSGTAFHWIDPEIKFRKSAQLCRMGSSNNPVSMMVSAPRIHRRTASSSAVPHRGIPHPAHHSDDGPSSKLIACGNRILFWAYRQARPW
jgi:hypothetical protein